MYIRQLNQQDFHEPQITGDPDFQKGFTAEGFIRNTIGMLTDGAELSP